MTRVGTSADVMALALVIPRLAGCAAGPDYQIASIELPTRWSSDKRNQPQQPPVLVQWWRRLNDGLLNQLIDEAVRGSLDVAAATARIREARASRNQAIGALFPTIDGFGSAFRPAPGRRILISMRPLPPERLAAPS